MGRAGTLRALKNPLLCGFHEILGFYRDALKQAIGGYGWTRTTDPSIMSAVL